MDSDEVMMGFSGDEKRKVTRASPLGDGFSMCCNLQIMVH
jgi:hypothetical protein